MYLAIFFVLLLDMTLLLDLNEGLPKEISENMFYLPKKSLFRETVLLYLLNLFIFFDCPSNNVFCIENRR